MSAAISWLHFPLGTGSSDATPALQTDVKLNTVSWFPIWAKLHIGQHSLLLDRTVHVRKRYGQTNGQKHFCSCDGKFGFFHDLILVEVLELNGIVWIIVGSVVKLFDSCSWKHIQGGCSWFMNFNRGIWLMNSVDWDNYFVFYPTSKNSKFKNLCWSLWCSCIDFEFGNALLKFGSFSGSMMGLKCCSSVQFLLKIRSDQFRIHDTIVCSGTMLWLFSLAWDAVLLTLKVGFICRSVVIDSTDLGETTELLFQELCLSTLNLSPTQNTCLLPKAITCSKASLSVKHIMKEPKTPEGSYQHWNLNRMTVYDKLGMLSTRAKWGLLFIKSTTWGFSPG